MAYLYLHYGAAAVNHMPTLIWPSFFTKGSNPELLCADNGWQGNS